VRTGVTLIVPLFDEEDVLPGLFTRLGDLRSALDGEFALHFLLVDDGSRDGTLALARRLARDLPETRVIAHDRNRGIAGAIATGLARSTTEIAASIDADGSYDARELASMVPMIADADLVTASPYHPGGRVEGVPPLRLFLSRSASALYRAIFRQKLHTYTSCFRVYRRSSFEGIRLRSEGFSGIAEMAAYVDRRGGRIVEHPATLGVRRAGRSKARLAAGIAEHARLAAALWRLRRGA